MIAVQIDECIANSWMQCNAMVDAEESGCSTVAWTGSPITRGSVGSAGAERERARSALRGKHNIATHVFVPTLPLRPDLLPLSSTSMKGQIEVLWVEREQKRPHSYFGWYKTKPYAIGIKKDHFIQVC